MKKLFIITISLAAVAVTNNTAMAQPIKVHFINKSDAVVHVDYTDCEKDEDRGDKLDSDKNLPFHSHAYFACEDFKSLILTQYSGPYAKEAKCSVQRKGSGFKINKDNKHCSCLLQIRG